MEAGGSQSQELAEAAEAAGSEGQYPASPQPPPLPPPSQDGSAKNSGLGGTQAPELQGAKGTEGGGGQPKPPPLALPEAEDSTDPVKREKLPRTP